MKRVLIHSHDMFGLGNIRRMLELARYPVQSSSELSVPVTTGSPMPGRGRRRPRRFPQRAGELLTKLAGDTNLLRDVFADSVLTFAAHLLSLPAMLGVMFWLDWQLALMVVTTLPLLLAVIVVLHTRVNAPVRDLGRLSAKFSRAAVSAQRVNEILEIESDTEDAPDAIDLYRPAGEIVFEDVCFGYAQGRPVLDHVSLRIAAGERVALVGPSGTGKSTLLSLLLRLYEPGSGRILIDGIDIRRFRRGSLRRAIGIVPQDNMLFAASVRENIAYGHPQASLVAIKCAAQYARAHEFIIDLAEGYDTEIDARGSSLSGGERRRLCLARALVKRPAIMLMDEPTSSIDAASARLIQEALARVHRDRTLLVIARECADMASYDRVLVLDQGRLVESRSHETLVKARGTHLALVEYRHA